MKSVISWNSKTYILRVEILHITHLYTACKSWCLPACIPILIKVHDYIINYLFSYEILNGRLQF